MPGRIRCGNSRFPPSATATTMKYETLVLMICVYCGQGYNLTPRIFLQLVDHKQPNGLRFNQRYWVTRLGRNPPSVGFLMISGEQRDEYPLQGAWMEYARQLAQEGVGIVCFELEHRYYGESKPHTYSYEFLSSDQALADIAHFLTSLSPNYSPPTLKWVVFGGSYAGTLAAWARQMYPNLIHAAIASSAPMEAKAELPEYFEVVRKSLETVSHECPSMLNWLVAKRGFRELAQYIGLVQEGKQRLFCELVRCVGQSSKLEFCIYSLNIHQNTRKYDSVAYDDSSDFPKNNTTMTRVYIGGRGFERSTWIKHQVCKEFGWFQTSNSEYGLLGRYNSLQEEVSERCNSDFQTLYNGIAKINAEHGGKSFSTERVLFIHGTLDPWNVVGVTSSSWPEMPVHIIEGGSHCFDMLDANQITPQLRQEVLKAQMRAMYFLRKWLQLRP